MESCSYAGEKSALPVTAVGAGRAVGGCGGGGEGGGGGLFAGTHLLSLGLASLEPLDSDRPGVRVDAGHHRRVDTTCQTHRMPSAGHQQVISRSPQVISRSPQVISRSPQVTQPGHTSLIQSSRQGGGPQRKGTSCHAPVLISSRERRSKAECCLQNSKQLFVCHCIQIYQIRPIGCPRIIRTYDFARISSLWYNRRSSSFQTFLKYTSRVIDECCIVPRLGRGLVPSPVRLAWD